MAMNKIQKSDTVVVLAGKEKGKTGVVQKLDGDKGPKVFSLNTASNKVSVQVEIDMDYNSDENHKSNKLISATKGWANSLGYKVNVKPNNQIATRAADHHCK